LADPSGCDYFSLGPCGARPGDMGRIDNFEKLLDWLPGAGEKGYKDFFDSGTRQRTAYMQNESFKMFNFVKANLYRVYGAQWEKNGRKFLTVFLKAAA
jgi:hypothetical protein